VSRTFKLTIAYDGTEFAGWQVQPGKPTIQGSLERAIQRAIGEQVPVIGSGRTDAGVHALAQVASCTLARWRDDDERLAHAINTRLPNTIVVTESVAAADDFHPIRDAIGKEYRYQLQVGGIRDAFEHRYRWHLHGRLDLDQMRSAAERFVGVHDFASFQASGSDRKTTTRHIRRCALVEQETSDPNRSHLAIEIEADGFLYNMVRNIVGTLIEVGRRKQPPQWIDEVFEQRNRNAAGQTAPAHGLFLARVDYAEP
jgi:tRNA pseudouridine38-40 synthase